MRSGRLHVAGFNTGSNPLAVNCAGFRSFVIMGREDDTFGYEMEIITYPGSGIEKVEDIKGNRLAFTSPTSNSGFKAPSAILKAEFNMLADTDFTPEFSGKHDNSILGVANKDYPAASIANSVKDRMIARDVIKADQVVTIYKSQTFPTTGFGVAHNLNPDLQKKIEEAFFTFKWVNDDGTPSSLKIAFLAARITTPSVTFIRPLALLFIVASRSINSLIWALLLVAIMGPGILAGTIAIALRSIGFCAKLLYEAIEEIDKAQVEAITATGAKKSQIMSYGILPQIMPAFAGITVFRWDINIRESTVRTDPKKHT